MLLLMVFSLRACLWSTSQILIKEPLEKDFPTHGSMCVLFVDEKIIAEEMSSYRRNQQRTEIIDQDFVPRTVLSCAAILG